MSSNEEINLAGLSAVSRLQALVERDKGQLARRMHDELGGYLLAAGMDVVAIRQQNPPDTVTLIKRLDRITEMLRLAVDLTREVTEELHPTLLDNVGLFAAWRWHVKRVCSRTTIQCTAHFPDLEIELPPATSILIYRIGENALTIAEQQKSVRFIDFGAVVDDDSLLITVQFDTPASAPDNVVGSEALMWLRQRLQSMNSDLQWKSFASDTTLTIRARLLPYAGIDQTSSSEPW